jgi:hypothetical protein
LRSGILEFATVHEFTADSISQISFGEFVSSLSRAFDNVSDLEVRYRTMVDVANALKPSRDGMIRNELLAAKIQLEGPEGFYATLDSIEAFRVDPQRKKSRVLVQQLYLRTERVVHLDSLFRKGENGRATDVRSVTSLRRAVESAMQYTSVGAEMSLAELNELEWQIGRSYCTRNEPRCTGPHLENKRVASEIMELNQDRCPLQRSCNGAIDLRVRLLVEPRLAEHHAYY